MTRANNRDSIEAALQGEVHSRPRFLHYDLPGPFIALKKRGILPTKFYYLLWQVGVAIKHRKIVPEYDLVHHVTFNSFVLPGFWWLMRAKTVLGPLGGGMVVRSDYLPLFHRHRWKERLRTLFVRAVVYFPPTYLSLRRASYVFCANHDTLKRLPSSVRIRSAVLLDTALDVAREELPKGRPEKKDGALALWVGSLEPRKGLELALRALAAVADVRMEIIGTGQERDRLKRLVEELGLGGRIAWRGRLPHRAIRPAMASGDMFLFTSVRDTSGNVVLEAMSAALPVVAINHQGVAEILDPDCGVLIEPGTLAETVGGFASAITRLANDPGLRQRMGANGRNKLATRFSWRKNRDAMDEVYRKVMEIP
jgi:glycosyltransferase involved in cell wall biosynthesis